MRLTRALRSSCATAIGVAFATVGVGQQTAAAPVRDVRGKVTGGGDEKIRVTVLQHDMYAGTIEPVGERYAEADGSFTFERLPWFDRYAWGHACVFLLARGKQRVGLVELRGHKVATDDVRIALTVPVDVSGVLRSEDNKPIAGAWVWPYALGILPEGGAKVSPTAPLPPWQTTTDAQGRFTLKGLPALLPLRLLAGSRDFAREWVDVDDASRPVVATLKPGGRIRGMVRMPDGNPATQVRVRGSGRTLGYGFGVTDDTGHFELSGLRSDIYKVWAEVPDLTVIACVDLRVAPGSVVEDQTIQLVRGGFIVGRIVDKATGKPIVPGDYTDVAMYGPARGEGGACEATPVMPDGTFRIRAPAGMNRIYLRGADGYEEPTERVEVREGQETKVEWQLRGGRKR